MSKLYMINRMQGSPAAGSIFTAIGKGLKGVVNFVKGGVKSLSGAKSVTKVVETALPVAKAAAPYLAAGAAGAAASQLLGGGGSGASGSWAGGGGVRRRRGITATELRGFRKVARLLHKEGMVVKRARRG